jgi:hypothetical protein
MSFFMVGREVSEIAASSSQGDGTADKIWEFRSMNFQTSKFLREKTLIARLNVFILACIAKLAYLLVNGD